MSQLAKTIFEHKNLLFSADPIQITVDQIDSNLDVLSKGRTIKIMNAIDQDNDGCFVMYGESFIVVLCNNSIAKAAVLTEEQLVDILSIFYACRELSLLPSDRSDRIFDLSRKLDRIVHSIVYNGAGKL